MREAHPTNTEGPTALVRAGSAYYSLWDVDSGNSLGTYDTEQEVWEIIRTLLEANGPSYADDLDLAREDTEGNYEHVATGTALLKMAELTGHRRTA